MYPHVPFLNAVRCHLVSVAETQTLSQSSLEAANGNERKVTPSSSSFFDREREKENVSRSGAEVEESLKQTPQPSPMQDLIP